MTNNINICYCTDKGYWFLFLVSLCSLLKSKKQTTHIDLYLLLSQFNKKEIDVIYQFLTQKKIVENHIYIHVFDIAKCKYMSSLTQEKNYPSSVFIRLLIPSLLKNIDKILYIDCDTIIQKDISDIFNCELGKNVFGAIPDFGIALNKNYIEDGCNDKHVVWLNSLKYIVDYDRLYFNSGILLYNLIEIHSFDFDKLCYIHFNKKNSVYRFPDQDLINFLFGEKIKALPLEFNNQFCLFENHETEKLYNSNIVNKVFKTNYSSIEDFINRSYILHFSMDKEMMFNTANGYYKFNEFILQKIFDMAISFEMIGILMKLDFSSFSSIKQQINTRSLQEICSK